MKLTVVLLLCAACFIGCSPTGNSKTYVGEQIIDMYDKDKTYRTICLSGVQYYSSTARYNVRYDVLSVRYDDKTLKPKGCYE